MSKRNRKIAGRLIRWLLIVLLILGACGLIAPMINAARFSGRIREALESSLGRKVEFEQVYFNVFTGPGFTLKNVVIGEDPRYGIEPFAFVPEMNARLRLDKLMKGEIQFANLRFESPSLNLVKRLDGSWNVIELLQRLSAPRTVPMSLFPALEISDGRIDFKLGLRKTILYISDTDVSIYPQRSGKVYIRFSGSPARTDRAGMGFGHMRGDVNWYPNVGAEGRQLEANVSLDPSNLSEITTLIEGHDAGVHGTISSRFQAAGPVTNLSVTGELHLNDIHRWDLLPASGEEWSVRYGGRVDLKLHRADLQTQEQAGEPTPVLIKLRIDDFLAHPTSSVVAELKGAPLAKLMPLASRLGLALPEGANLQGTVNGAVGYSRLGGWSGGLAITQAEAVMQGVPALNATEADVTLAGGRLHVEPTILETGTGKLKLSGDYLLSTRQTRATLSATGVPLDEIKPLANSWLGSAGPLASMSDGTVSGQLTYSHNADSANPEITAPASWSGQFTLQDATIAVPGLTLPLQDARGKLSFRDNGFEIDRLTANLGGQSVRVSYRFNPLAKRAERAQVELSRADLSELEGFLAGSNASGGFWSRLRLGHRSIPGFFHQRNLEGDLAVDHFFAGGQPLGTLNSHFICEDAQLTVESLALKMPQGRIDAHGTVDLAADNPEWRFSATAMNYPWSGGSLNAQGQFKSSGAGQDVFRNFRANGTFSGEGLAISQDTFETVNGAFEISFENGWPDLRLSNVQALENGSEWTGDGLTGSDGRLFINLEHGGRKVHFVSTLTGDTPATPLSATPGEGEPTAVSVNGLKF